jgi:hypothetical protein
MEKTGLTEAGILVTILGVFEGVQHFALENPLLPDPWGSVLTGVLGIGVVLLRHFSKQKQA